MFELTFNFNSRPQPPDKHLKLVYWRLKAYQLTDWWGVGSVTGNM